MHLAAVAKTTHDRKLGARVAPVRQKIERQGIIFLIQSLLSLLSGGYSAAFAHAVVTSSLNLPNDKGELV
jgi:hypothetical protein